MKIIAIRGLPGSGKGTIAEKLGQQINKAEVVSVDEYKKDFQATGGRFIDSLKYSYQKTLERLEQLYTQNHEALVIVEELFNDAEFVRSIQDFCAKNGVEIHWFNNGPLGDLDKEVERIVDLLGRSDELTQELKIQ